MDLKEFDALLHDAEVKMKRLKALYEQWFQGIERTEPQVARKDLERLFVLLNKDKPRNTAARFRLQQLVARYSIYTTLWGRVTRQIEEGTYERDVRRAQRVRGMPAERAAAKEFEVDLDEDIELDEELFRATDEIASVLGALDELTPALAAPAPKPALSAFSPFAMKKGAQTAKQPAAPSSAPRDAAPKAAAPKAAAPKAAAPTMASPILAAPSVASPKPPTPTSEGPAPPTTSTFKKPVVATFGKPKVTTDSSGTRATPGPAGAPRPPVSPASASGAPTTPVVPAREPRPAVAIPSPARVPQPASQDTQLKGLYDRYVDARRRNNERVDNVAYDKLAESVQQMKSKLREKHGDKNIDFEVVVQNGKVGIKPKIG